MNPDQPVLYFALRHKHETNELYSMCLAVFLTAEGSIDFGHQLQRKQALIRVCMQSPSATWRIQLRVVCVALGSQAGADTHRHIQGPWPGGCAMEPTVKPVGGLGVPSGSGLFSLSTVLLLT